MLQYRLVAQVKVQLINMNYLKDQDNTVQVCSHLMITFDPKIIFKNIEKQMNGLSFKQSSINIVS